MQYEAVENWAGDTGPKPRQSLQRGDIIIVPRQAKNEWWNTVEGFWVPSSCLRKIDLNTDLQDGHEMSESLPLSPKSKSPSQIEFPDVSIRLPPTIPLSAQRFQQLSLSRRSSRCPGIEPDSGTDPIDIHSYRSVDNIETPTMWIPFASDNRLIYVDPVRKVTSNTLLFAPAAKEIPEILSQATLPDFLTNSTSSTPHLLVRSSVSSSRGSVDWISANPDDPTIDRLLYRKPEFIGASLRRLRHTKGEFFVPGPGTLTRDLFGVNLSADVSYTLTAGLEFIIDAANAITERRAAIEKHTSAPSAPEMAIRSPTASNSASAHVPSRSSARSSRLYISSENISRDNGRDNMRENVREAPAKGADHAPISPVSTNERSQPATLSSSVKHIPGTLMDSVRTVRSTIKAASRVLEDPFHGRRRSSQQSQNSSSQQSRASSESTRESLATAESLPASRRSSVTSTKALKSSEDDLAAALQDAMRALGCGVRRLGASSGVPLGAAPALLTGSIALRWRLVLNSLLKVKWSGGDPSELVDWAVQFGHEAARLGMKRGNTHSVAYFDCIGAEWTDVIWDHEGGVVLLGKDTDDNRQSEGIPLEFCGVPRAVPPALTEDLAAHAAALQSCTDPDLILAHGNAAVLLSNSIDVRPFAKTSELEEFLGAKEELMIALMDATESNWKSRSTERPTGNRRICTTLLSERSESRIESRIVAAAIRLSVTEQRLLRPIQTSVEVGIKPQTIYDMNGNLRGGTKSAIIQEITRHDTSRQELASALLMTYPIFMSPTELIDLLTDRFAILPSLALSKEEYESWLVNVQMPIRLRVVDLLMQWIDLYWSNTEAQDAQLQLLVSRFVHRLVQTEFPNAGALADSFALRKSEAEVSNSDSTPSIPFETPLPLRDHTGRSLLIEDVPLQELARQLTIRKSHYYKKMTPRACLLRAVSHHDGESMTRFVDYWNQESCWFGGLILNASNRAERIKKIEMVIELSKECQKLHNYSTMMAIIAAMYGAAIYRLKDTWASVPREYVSDLQAMCRLLNSSRNFSEYREIITHVNEPSVPFLGVSLTDLRFALDGNPDFLNDSTPKVINMAKWTMCANIVSDMLRFQKLHYPLAPVVEIQDWLDQDIAASHSLEEQYELSLKIEPRRHSSQQPKVSGF